MIVHCGIDNRVARNHALASQPRDKNICILKVGILPGRAGQPERVLRRARQRHISPVEEVPWKERRNERAQLETDAEPFAVCGTLCPRRRRFGTAERQKNLAPVPRHGHLEMTCRYREKRPGALAVRTPDTFNEWRIR